MKENKARYSVIIIIILHSVAVMGLFLGYLEYILPLTPINLLITTYLLYLNQRETNTPFIISSVIIVVFAYLVEVIGVNTGLFFGNYEYLNSLGPKVFATPPVIGFNWWILIVTSASFFRRSKWPVLAKAFAASLLMLFVDLWIEPVSHQLDFWKWEDDIIPLKNYLGWFITGFALQILYWQSPFSKRNSIGIPVYFILFTFFIILNLFLE
jgi:putative membrane protein